LKSTPIRASTAPLASAAAQRSKQSKAVRLESTDNSKVASGWSAKKTTNKSRAKTGPATSAQSVSALGTEPRTRLEKLKFALPRGLLAKAVYDDASTPKGYARASTDATLLKKLGLKASDLVGPADSGFKAEVFIPEDKTQKPVVAFRGTSVRPDYATDGKQAVGLREDSYTRAMELAAKLKNKGIDAEFTGHSLGGGLAAAAALSSGKTATTFNSAGVHGNTVQEYLKTHQQSLPSGSRITNIAVEGDPLTEIQTNSAQIGPETARILAGTGSNLAKLVDFIQPSAKNSKGATQLLTSAEKQFLYELGQHSEKLRQSPLGAGETMTVPARYKNGVPRKLPALTTSFLAGVEQKVAAARFGDVGKSVVLKQQFDALAPELRSLIQESVVRHGLYVDSIKAEIGILEGSSSSQK
jgi:hypothetical protein